MMIEEPQKTKHKCSNKKEAQRERKNPDIKKPQTKQPKCSPKRGEVGGKNQKRELSD